MLFSQMRPLNDMTGDSDSDTADCGLQWTAAPKSQVTSPQLRKPCLLNRSTLDKQSYMYGGP